MRVGFITERMLRGFGVDLVIDRVAKGLAARGHEVTVYASVTDETLGDGDYRLELIPTPAHAFFPRYDASAQRHLEQLNQAGNDVYLVETFPFFSLLPRLAPPAVAVDHGVCSTEGFPARLRANFAYMRYAQQHGYFRFADTVVTVSGYLKRELPSFLQGRTRVIYNGADHYQGGDGKALRRELGVQPEEVLLLYVGRLNPRHQPYKGTSELVQVFRVLRRTRPEVRLLMVGFGSDEDRRWLEGEGVLVMANAPAEQMPSIFAACDIYVTASRWEGFDLPLVEAQSFGKPVVALDIGAHPEVVGRNRSGFLVENTGELGGAIALLAADRRLRAAMGAAARENAARFTWAAAVAAYEELLQEVTA